MSVDDLGYAGYSWSVSEFRPIFVDGVSYCHYFTGGLLGRPVTNARQLVLKETSDLCDGT